MIKMHTSSVCYTICTCVAKLLYHAFWKIAIALRNQADMTIAHEKMSPKQQRIRCAVRAVGDGIERSNFCFIHFKSIRKKRAPIPYTT